MPGGRQWAGEQMPVGERWIRIQCPAEVRRAEDLHDSMILVMSPGQDGREDEVFSNNPGTGIIACGLPGNSEHEPARWVLRTAALKGRGGAHSR